MKRLLPALAVTAMFLATVAIGVPPAIAQSPPTTTCLQGGTDAQGWTDTTCYDAPNVSLPDTTNNQAWTLKWLQTVDGVDGYCDADEVLRNDVDARGRAVPNGVSVQEPGGIGVTAGFYTGSTGYSVGIKQMSMTNWGVQNTVSVTMHCTTTTSAGYQ